MSTLQKRYKGLGLLMSLNWDRVLYFCTIIFALMLGAFVGTL